MKTSESIILPGWIFLTVTQLPLMIGSHEALKGPDELVLCLLRPHCFAVALLVSYGLCPTKTWNVPSFDWLPASRQLYTQTAETAESKGTSRVNMATL